MKKIRFVLVFLLISLAGFTQNLINLDILGVKVKGGALYVSLFNNEQAYKEKLVFLSVKAEPVSETVSIPLTLPEGEYFFSVFQDSNNNGILDANLFGIPKELVELSNYDGKSVPGNFNRHKVLVSNTSKNVKVQLLKI